MTGLEVILILLAGLWAGAINAVVGSGTLVTFPVLVALGYPPLTATTSNAIGLVAGGVSGVWGYRRELTGQRSRLAVLAPASVAGGVVGSLLLLGLEASVFEAAVPVLIVVALALVLLQPVLQQRVRRSVERRTAAGEPPGRRTPLLAVLLTGLVGVYGGYFTAAQGILLVAVLGSLLVDDLQRLNAAKNVLTLVVNVVAAVLYVMLDDDVISWPVVGLIAASSLVGGYFGARWGRLLRPAVLRVVIVALGLLALGRVVLA